jgi:hypothetical protein
MEVTSAWWVSRSMRVTMQVASGKTAFQSLKARLVATSRRDLSGISAQCSFFAFAIAHS